MSLVKLKLNQKEGQMNFQFELEINQNKQTNKIHNNYITQISPRYKRYRRKKKYCRAQYHLIKHTHSFTIVSN